MKKQKGFTLVELLLVMAIIGILAGTILVSISGQREKARAGRTLESMNAILPYAVECYITETDMTSPAAASGGGILCGSISYPELGDGCSYVVSDPDSTGTIVANCGSYNISCDIEDEGNCVSN